jgi:starch synthase (maltosyl-transferring)
VSGPSPCGGRIAIQGVRPQVDCARYDAKAVVGERVTVAADLVREGHERLAAAVRYRPRGEQGWREAPLELAGNDRYAGSFPAERIGRWEYRIVAWTDHWTTWRRALQAKVDAGVDDAEIAVELAEGAELLRRRELPERPGLLLWEAAAAMTADTPLSERVAAATDPSLHAVLAAHPERLDATESPTLTVWVDRQRALFGAWYEMFPRSEGAVVPEEGPPRSGTLATAARRLPAIAEMGFDVVYLPPIHPIGETHRKGHHGPHDLQPGPHDPGVPWAIGSAEGGHDAVHPDLGTMEDFDAFLAEAHRLGMEVAMDYALQCSPDHPWVTQHPEWFRHRSDGSIRCAENPPKKYQDIYPLDFDTPDQEGLYSELERVLRVWIDRGVRIFRVDNPHTKPLGFWEWLIERVRADHPEVIFLAEAFTRPKMMATLAKLGFSQSYTYFAWRNTKQELTEYLTELTTTPTRDYLRPSFWPNTPDILPAYLQQGGRPAFKVRLLLAALLSPSYGIYAGYELCENAPLDDGSEEYLGSEKHFYRPREWDRPDSLAPYIARVNALRHAHPSLQQLTNLAFHHIDNEHLLCFSKVAPHHTDPILAVINLDPAHPQEASTALDLGQLGLEHAAAFEAHDLLTGARYVWEGPHNYVHLDPHVEPAHVLALSPL